MKENYQRVLKSTKKIQVRCLTDEILASINADFPKRNLIAKKEIADARLAVQQTKIVLYVEGPLGIGKGSLGERICDLLEIPLLLENPEDPEVKMNLGLLYGSDKKVRQIGARHVNLAYSSQRLLNEATARRAPSSYGLDRLIHMDEIYMDAFVDSDLMTAEDRDQILKWNAEALDLLRVRGYNAPKEIMIQMVGSPELVYTRKNGRGRGVEKETGSGGGVSLEYITDICQRYNHSIDILEKRGFEGLVIEVDQELPGKKIFAPDEERHLIPIIKAISEYIK